MSDEFGEGPVVTGPVVDGLGQAGESAAAALAGLRAAGAWPDAPRPVAADALLAERALDGDPLARGAAARAGRRSRCRPPAARCWRRCAPCSTAAATWRPAPGRSSCTPTPSGTGCKRAAELTGHSATDPRGSWTLQVALALAELDRDRSLWH